ncbi:MAG TPA: aryl-sulfate sulfotransferase [Methylocella sp.]|nr:aryl-sulfate sulfotransferase [Methylocella sp.]
MDWDGQVLGEWGGDKAPGGGAQQHHDWAHLPNGHTLVLANLIHPVVGFSEPQVRDDVVHEIAQSDEIVWKWIASEHLE